MEKEGKVHFLVAVVLFNTMHQSLIPTEFQRTRSSGDLSQRSNVSCLSTFSKGFGFYGKVKFGPLGFWMEKEGKVHFLVAVVLFNTMHQSFIPTEFQKIRSFGDLSQRSNVSSLSTFSKGFGGGQVVRWCWVNFQRRGVLLICIIVGQGSIALAVVAGGSYLDIFPLVYHFSLLSPPLGDGPI